MALAVEIEGSAEPGSMRIDKGRWFLACGSGTWIEVLDAQLEGKKRMPAADFLRGHALKSGEKLT